MKSSRQLAFLSLLFASNCFGMAGFNAWSDSQYNYLGTEIIKSATTHSSNTRNSNSKKSQVADKSARSVAGANVSGRYAVSAPITRQVKDQFIKSRAKLAPNPASFANLINKVDIEMVFADLMGKHGLQSRDLSDAMTGYWLTLWTIVHNTDMPDRNAVAGVRNQMRNSLAETGFGNKSDAEKQRHAQMTVLKILEVLAANQRPGMNRSELADEMQKTGMHFGMNLAKLEVTEKGFTPKR